MFTAIHLRRQFITHMVGNIDLLYPAVKQGILENYGWQEEGDDVILWKKWDPQYIFMGSLHETELNVGRQCDSHFACINVVN